MVVKCGQTLYCTKISVNTCLDDIPLISYFLDCIVVLLPCAPPPYASLLTSLPLGLVALLMRSFSAAYALKVAVEERLNG